MMNIRCQTSYWALTLNVLWGMVFLACSREEQIPVDIAHNLPEKVDFNFHILPILSDRCFSCHGPDEVAREADLRLDVESEAYRRSSDGRRIIHPRRLKKSEVWHRIYSLDPEEMMPPPKSNLHLTDYEKALISRWISQGATYKPHWAFTSPEKPDLPKVDNRSAVRNSIDNFVLSKLESQGLSFSSEANKEQLLRRVTFDLTGLPPTIAEIEAFLADNSPGAYEKVVDGLLATDACAERLTMDWLDLARYADSQGLHSDGWRSMYPWRDWVISAFRQNMPFDQFLTWQLAGDLMPDPGREQLIATGFNRNHKTTAEGGIVDEEYRQEYVHDRVATTGTVFLGLTVECARCHDHKYDPISQEEYYRFFAFFNQIDELGMTGDDGNAGPNLLLPASKTTEKIAEIQASIKQKQQELIRSEAEIALQKDFIKELDQSPSVIHHQCEVFLPFDRLINDRIDGKSYATLTKGAEMIQTDRGWVVALDGEYEYITLRDQGLFEQNEPFAGAVWVYPEGRSVTQTIVGNTGQKGVFWRGWDLYLDSLNRLSFRLVNALPHDVVAIHTMDSVPVRKWTHVAFSYDGMGKAKGIKLFMNGVEKNVQVRYDCLQRSVHPISFSKEKSNTPLRLGKSYRAFTGEYGIFAGKMDEFYLFGREISSLEVGELAGVYSVAEILQEFRQAPSDVADKKLLETWKIRYAHPLEREIAALRLEQINLLDTVPEVMVMQEMPETRTTYRLNRGQYDQPQEAVLPGTPASILLFQDTLPRNRLGLARWLLDPQHPLTARVTVNRFWQQFFGRGLVDTPHDFGLQGSLPTHPALLDWLAVTFVESGWNVRAMLRMIVLSATYRQSSIIHPELRQQDPDNLLLARGPSYRLPAEMIRDNALATSGLLNHTVGGPSVKPVQPEGLWQEKTSSTHILRAYEPDSGSARYRRSMYTFLRRTSPPPMMTVFDVPNRSVCSAQRQRTNTPMQALTLLNDPQFVEAARELAQNMLRQYDDPDTRLKTAFRLLTGHFPSANQLHELLQLYQEEYMRFAGEPQSASRLLAIGQYPVEETLPPLELAALTITVNTIMNFDAFYMKR